MDKGLKAGDLSIVHKYFSSTFTALCTAEAAAAENDGDYDGDHDGADSSLCALKHLALFLHFLFAPIFTH